MTFIDVWNVLVQIVNNKVYSIRTGGMLCDIFLSTFRGERCKFLGRDAIRTE
jgi:hypothetical protein